jgi:anti-sigma regulatory factor (Ser/Thr protein kinase)
LTVMAERFAHPAFLYRGTDEYLSGIIPFVLEGLAAGEPVAVAVPTPNLSVVKAGLGALAASIEFIDMTEAGRNPGRIIPGVLLAFADAHPGPVRLVGEPMWAGRSTVEFPACAQHEALVNVALQGRQMSILCPYDMENLTSSVLADAFRTHSVMLNAAGTWASAAYAPDDVVAEQNLPFPAPISPAIVEFDVAGLSAARHFAAEHGARLGLTPERLEDLALAASELCANSVLHGQGRGILRVWSESGYVVCEVSDGGHIADPLAGRRPTLSAEPGGRGLLLVNRLADLVRIRHRSDGTTVRVYLKHENAA